MPHLGAMPVAVTTARPRPLATAVPLKTMLAGRPAAGPASVAASLSTASLSPVSDASATLSAAASAGARRRAGIALGQEQVAGDDVGAGMRTRRPSRSTRRRRGGHPLEGRHRLLGLAFLDEAEHAVGGHDQADHDRLERHAVGAFQGPGHHRDRDGRQEQVDQRVGELGEQLAPGRHLGRRLQAVAAGPGQARGRLGRAQPHRRADTQRPGHLGRVDQRRVGGQA